MQIPMYHLPSLSGQISRHCIDMTEIYRIKTVRIDKLFLQHHLIKVHAQCYQSTIKGKGYETWVREGECDQTNGTFETTRRQSAIRARGHLPVEGLSVTLHDASVPALRAANSAEAYVEILRSSEEGNKVQL